MNKDGVDGTDEGLAPSLSVNDAAAKFEGLLSGLEDNADSENDLSSDESDSALESDSDAEDGRDEEPVDGETDDEEDDSSDDDSDDAEEDGDAEGEAEDEHEQPATHRVKVDGEEIEVTLPELLAGYSRTTDYTRKTQALAAEKKAHEQDFQSVQRERQEYQQSLAQLRAALDTAGAEPDWARLRAESPEDFAATYAAWQQHKERIAAVEKEQQRVGELQRQQYQRDFQDYVKQEQEKLAAAIPEWKDQKVASSEKRALVDYARGIGFTDEELSQVVDHRAVNLLRKAYLYDKAQAAKPAARKKVSRAKTARPGTGGKMNRQTSQVTKAKQRLAKTGRVSDAATVLLAFDDE